MQAYPANEDNEVDKYFITTMKDQMNHFNRYYYVLLVVDFIGIAMSCLSIGVFTFWIHYLLPTIVRFYKEDHLFIGIAPSIFNCTLSFYGTGGRLTLSNTLCGNNHHVAQRSAVFWVYLYMSIILTITISQITFWISFLRKDKQK